MFVKKKFKIEKMFSVLAYTSIVAVMMLESAHAQDSASRDVLERYGNLNVTREGPTIDACLLYTSPSPRDGLLSRMPSSA